jgi:UDP-3-O-[3-hydroxymyristoyl] glucosamine N-acyltransferase
MHSVVPAMRLADLAQAFNLQIAGDADIEIIGVCSLLPGKPRHLSFCADARLRSAIGQTHASALVLAPRDAKTFGGNALIAADPAVAFARIAKQFDDRANFIAGWHSSASIADDAKIGADCWIGAGAVIESNAVIGANSFIGPNCVIGRDAVIGEGSRLEANVWIASRCRLGARAQVQPGAVIGSRGFGLARAKSGWIEVPQLGAVIVGDDVEIGANTTIDRGALDDTVIENGVKLDNQIQIAHNCRIGADTAIAACVGIAGSTRIGARCLIGGAAGIGGHLEIGDDIVILGLAMVTKSLSAPGVYGSGLPVMPAREWRKLVGRVRRLPRTAQRMQAIEQALKIKPSQGDSEVEQDDF